MKSSKKSAITKQKKSPGSHISEPWPILNNRISTTKAL